MHSVVFETWTCCSLLGISRSESGPSPAWLIVRASIISLVISHHPRLFWPTCVPSFYWICQVWGKLRWMSHVCPSPVQWPEQTGVCHRELPGPLGGEGHVHLRAGRAGKSHTAHQCHQPQLHPEGDSILSSLWPVFHLMIVHHVQHLVNSLTLLTATFRHHTMQQVNVPFSDRICPEMEERKCKPQRSYTQASHETDASCGLDVCLQADNAHLYTVPQIPEEQPEKPRWK